MDRTLRNLAAMKDRWQGTVVMIAQPAEESGSGAKAMLDDGLHTRFPKPAYAIAFHDSAALPAGTIGIRSGPTFASVDSVDIMVKGVGDHVAYPATTKDPIVLGKPYRLRAPDIGQPRDRSARIGGGHGRQLPGQDAAQCDPQTGAAAHRRHGARVARGEAMAAGVRDNRMRVVTVRANYTPATVSTDPLAGRLKTLFITARFGEARVQDITPTMAGEDFGRYHIADTSVQSVIY